MIPIFGLWQDFTSQANTWQGGFWAPQTDFVRAVNTIQREMLQEYVARWQENQVITDKISVFLKTVNLKLVDSRGLPYNITALPVDYLYYSSLRVVVNNGKVCGCKNIPVFDNTSQKECDCPNDDRYVDPDILELKKVKSEEGACENAVKIIDNQRWGAVCDSVTKAPTIYKPAVTMYSGGFKVYPKDVAFLVLDYFRKPKDAVFNYTLGPNDEIVFNSTGSVDLEWPESVQPEFVMRLLKKYGIFTSQENLYQMGEVEKQNLTK